MTQLMGTAENSIDEKGRVIIPHKFRDEMGTQCVLTLGKETDLPCLYVYPLAEWRAYADTLKDLPEEDENVRLYKNNFFSKSEKCDIDRQGRITIPPTARVYAKLEKDLVTMGVEAKLILWSKKNHEAYEENGSNQNPGGYIATLRKK
jgi:MraZ protein